MTHPPEETGDGLLGTVQAAAKLGISRRKLMELIYSGDIETLRVPRPDGSPGDHRIEPAEITRVKAHWRELART
jgi:hypothetical protein